MACWDLCAAPDIRGSFRLSFPSSELVQHKMGFARAGPFRPCFETMEPEWIPFCRAVSTHNLPWDCERPSTPAESLPSKERPREPRQPPPPLLLLRERAYSESHLGAEPASTSRRVERQGAPGLAKLEEARLELPPGAAKKRGPPPPRPPPPNWEQYCFRRASHHQLLPTEAGWSPAPGQSSTEVARQRSHSLPLDQLWNDTARLASSRRQESPSPPAPCHGSPGKGLKWTGADPSSSSSSSPRQVLLDLETPVAYTPGLVWWDWVYTSLPFSSKWRVDKGTKRSTGSNPMGKMEGIDVGGL